MKQINYQTKKTEELVIFEADDVNDPAWDRIINILRKSGIKVQYADGNWMNFIWEIKNEEN